MKTKLSKTESDEPFERDNAHSSRGSDARFSSLKEQFESAMGDYE